MKRLPSRRALLFPLLASFLPALLLIGGIELAVRAAFWLRNTLADVIPIVYVFGGDVGPVPPWRSSIHKGDRLLGWRGRPNTSENWVNIFAPAQSAATQRQLIRRFAPQLPDEFKAKPRDLVSLNSEGFRGGEFREIKPKGPIASLAW